MFRYGWTKDLKWEIAFSAPCRAHIPSLPETRSCKSQVCSVQWGLIDKMVQRPTMKISDMSVSWKQILNVTFFQSLSMMQRLCYVSRKSMRVWPQYTENECNGWWRWWTARNSLLINKEECERLFLNQLIYASLLNYIIQYYKVCNSTLLKAKTLSKKCCKLLSTKK